MSAREIDTLRVARGRKGRQLDPRWKDVWLWQPGDWRLAER